MREDPARTDSACTSDEIDRRSVHEHHRVVEARRAPASRPGRHLRRPIRQSTRTTQSFTNSLSQRVGGGAGNRTQSVTRSRATLFRETSTQPTEREFRRPTQGVPFRPFPPLSGHSLGHRSARSTTGAEPWPASARESDAAPLLLDADTPIRTPAGVRACRPGLADCPGASNVGCASSNARFGAIGIRDARLLTRARGKDAGIGTPPVGNREEKLHGPGVDV